MTDTRSPNHIDVCACGTNLIACPNCGDARCLSCDPLDVVETCGSPETGATA